MKDLLLQLPMYALGGVVLIVFLMKNPNRKYSLILLFAFVVWILSTVAQEIMFDDYLLPEIFIWFAVITYIIRFKNYESRRVIDWVKLISVVLFAVFESSNNVVGVSAVGVGLITLFVIDKSIYSNNLNENWKIALLLPFILSVISIGANLTILSEQHSALIESMIDDREKLMSAQSQLVNCEIKNKDLEIELKKIKKPN